MARLEIDAGEDLERMRWVRVHSVNPTGDGADPGIAFCGVLDSSNKTTDQVEVQHSVMAAETELGRLVDGRRDSGVTGSSLSASNAQDWGNSGGEGGETHLECRIYECRDMLRPTSRLKGRCGLFDYPRFPIGPNPS